MAMIQKLFHELPVEECGDFESVCARHGFVPEDFEVREEDGISQGSGSSPIPRMITVARVVGGDVQVYPATTGISWTVAFERDLERGDFGFPLAD